MFDTLKTITDRCFKSFIGIIKNIDPNRQTIPGTKNPEKILSNCWAPEYRMVNIFSLQIAQQLTPLDCESIRESDVGSLEEWGEIILKRVIDTEESIENYRNEIITVWNPKPKGGNRQDVLNFSLGVSGVRRVYSYVGSRGIDEINVDDIEGRLNGATVYVQSIDNSGIPTGAQLTNVYNAIVEQGSISTHSMHIVPVVLRPYSFEFRIFESVVGGGSSLADVQNKILDITYAILDKTQPYIKYVDDTRRDLVIAGQYLQEIRNVITKPPYRYTINDVKILQNGNDIQVEQLPAGNIPVMGGYSFV